MARIQWGRKATARGGLAFLLIRSSPLRRFNLVGFSTIISGDSVCGVAVFVRCLVWNLLAEAWGAWGLTVRTGLRVIASSGPDGANAACSG